MKPLFLLTLSAAVGLNAVSATQAQTSPPPAPKSSRVLSRVLIDRDELRSIEVVTDRHESIVQLFARRRIALGSLSSLNNKFVDNWSQLRISKPTKAFVSYPLHNDDGFQMKFFGHQIELMPPPPSVLNLFKNADPRDYRSYVVLAFDDDLSSDASQEKNRRAHLIGRVQVSGAWRPEDEKALLAFSPSAH